jgi:SOS-response transcriptional repressor LexA
MVEFNNFGEALKFFANKKKLSQKQLAIKCGIQEGQVSRHMRQGVIPEYGNVIKYSEILELSPEESKLLFSLAGYSPETRQIENIISHIKQEDEAKQNTQIMQGIKEIKEAVVSIPQEMKKLFLSQQINQKYIPEIQKKIAAIEEDTIPVSGTYTEKCPLLSGNAACGKPFAITDNNIEDYKSYPDDIETPDFAITAKGSSMIEHGIRPGSICFIKKVRPSNGDIAAICVYDNGDVYPVLKEVRYKNNLPEFYDGKNEKLYLGKDVEFDIIGKVVHIATTPRK